MYTSRGSDSSSDLGGALVFGLFVFLIITYCIPVIFF